MPTRTVIDQYRFSDAISETYWNEKYQYFNFSTAPGCSLKAGGAAAGAAGDENIMMFPEGYLEYHIMGTQTILLPVLTSISDGVSGLDIGMDQTDNDGVEICAGILSSNRNAFKVGTSAAFFCRTRFSIADVSGTDDCAFGFRKAEAYQANVDDYADMAVLNVISGDIKIETIVGSAATTTTDTTDNWADTETHELKILVSAAGVVTYLIDGVAPTTTAAFTLTTDLFVVPFLNFLNASDLAGAVPLLEWECGYQS